MALGHASRRVVRAVAGAATLGLLATGLGVGTASSAPADKPPKSDVRHVGGDYNDGKALPYSKEGAGGQGIKGDAFKIGTVRKWPALVVHTRVGAGHRVHAGLGK